VCIQRKSTVVQIADKVDLLLENNSENLVTPAQAGVHSADIILDSRLRGNDDLLLFVNSFKIRGLSIDPKKGRALSRPAFLRVIRSSAFIRF